MRMTTCGRATAMFSAEITRNMSAAGMATPRTRRYRVTTASTSGGAWIHPSHGSGNARKQPPAIESSSASQSPCT